MTQIRWEGFTHAELYERVHAGPGRGASTAVESAWADTEAVILGIEQQLAAAVTEVGAGWEGAAADATRAGLTPLGRWAMDAAGDARLTATGITSQGEQAAWLRNSMPSPTAPLWDEPGGRPVADPLYLLEDAQALEHKAAEDAAQAVHLMNSYTTHSYDNVRLMNYWTLPPTVTVEPAGGGQLSGPAAGVSSSGSGSVGMLPPTGPGWSASGSGPVGRGPVAGRPQASGPGAGGSGPGPAGRPPAVPVPPNAPRTGPASPSGPPGSGRPQPGPSALPPVPGPSWRDRLPSTRGPAAPPPAAEPSGAPGRGPAAIPGRGPTVGLGPGAPAGRGPSAEPSVVPGRGPVAEPGRSPYAEPTGPAGRSAAHPGGQPAPGYSTRPGTPGLYPPMFGLGSAGTDREHRRPDYLLDDGGAFVDDRWFPPPVIGPDDVPPAPPRWTA